MFFCGVGRRPHANGTRFGPFRVLKPWAESGLGPVFLGKHGLTGEKRLIRTLSSTFSGQPRARELFKREHQLRLNHPHILKKYGFKKQNESCYITEEYIDGVDLQQLLKERKRLTIPESLHILSQLSDALSFAHKNGALHGRLRPSKILLEGKTQSLFSQDSKNDHLEVCWIDGQVDLPSLGRFLYSLLRGRYLADHPTKLGLPVWLLSILLKMTDYNPKRRYETLDEVLNDLQLHSKQSHHYRQHPFIGHTIGDSVILEKIGEHRKGDVFLGQKNKPHKDSDSAPEWAILSTIRPRLSKRNGDMSAYKKTSFPEPFLNSNEFTDHYQFSENHGTLYIELDSLETQRIDRRLQRLGVFDDIEAIRIVRKACQAAKLFHDFDSFKEQLKPRYHALKTKLTGFQPMNEEKQDGLWSPVIGNPRYFSPEQCYGRKIDVRSDIYSLGAIFYEMLTGQAPFQGTTTSEVLCKHIEDSPERPQELNPEVSMGISKFVMKMLAKKPEQRFQSCDELLIELKRIQNRSSGKRLSELNQAFAGRYFFSKEIGGERRSTQYHGVDERKNPVTVTVLDGDAFNEDYYDLKRRAGVLSNLPRAHFLQVKRIQLNDAFPHMIEERMAGETLGQRIRARTSLGESELLDLALWTLIAVRDIHKEGYTHGSITPENIFLTTNAELKLLGSKFPEIGDYIDAEKLGLQFIAPEQFDNETSTIASDLYAVGACLYYAASGQWPYDKSRSRNDIKALKSQRAPKELCFLAQSISISLSDCIMKLLANKAKNRYQNTEEALIDLKWLASGQRGRLPNSRRGWLARLFS